MIILREIKFDMQFMAIVKSIAQDKFADAKKFEKKLNDTIKDLIHFLYKFRQSRYFKEQSYRDLIYNGYTIISKIETDKIPILEIFKWQER